MFVSWRNISQAVLFLHFLHLVCEGIWKNDDNPKYWLSHKGKYLFYINGNEYLSKKYLDWLYVQIFKSMALPTCCLSSQCLSGFIMSDYWSSVFPTPSIDHINSSSLPTQSLKYFDKIFQNIFASTKNCRKSNHQNLLFSQENSKLSLKTFLMFPDI